MSHHDYEEVLAPNVYFDRKFDIDAAKILPGEYYVTNRPMVLTTVLGSCVSACIQDPILGIGGMNHFMLPENNDKGVGMLSVSMRYGSYAMEVLVNQLLKLGANRNRLEAKVFGGGAVLRGFTTVNVGERNSDFVLDYLQAERIKVIAQDLRDIYPRKVYYFTETGRTLIRKLKHTHNNTIFDRETQYGQRLRQAEMSGDVELFK